MEIEIDYTRSAQENADDYFELSKRAKKKAEGADNATVELERKLGKVGNVESKKDMRKIEKREWYEKYNWFFTSSGMLAIGGRSAVQNEELNSKHFIDGDLFFHSDIFGASAVILKEGEKASPEVRAEAAQFAASFSSAWEERTYTVDVYSLRREQVTKSKSKGSLGTGSFFLVGEREWYKNVRLGLSSFLLESEEAKKLNIVPMDTCARMGIRHYASISPGNTKKSDAAKHIARIVGYSNIDYIMQHLPPGPFSIKEVR